MTLLGPERASLKSCVLCFLPWLQYLKIINSRIRSLFACSPCVFKSLHAQVKKKKLERFGRKKQVEFKSVSTDRHRTSFHSENKSQSRG